MRRDKIIELLFRRLEQALAKFWGLLVRLTIRARRVLRMAPEEVTADLSKPVTAGLSKPVTAWISQRIAEKWLRDAGTEAGRGEALRVQFEAAEAEEAAQTWQAIADSVRREIVFAACFAEAFLFEYVRDHVIGDSDNRRFDEFRAFMLEPEDDSLWGIFNFKNRWKQTAKALHLKGRLADPKAFFVSGEWSSLCQMIGYRNNLVHGNVGLPRETWDDDRKYEPSPRRLVDLGPRWATSVVLRSARALHGLNLTQTRGPSYLRPPHQPFTSDG